MASVGTLKISKVRWFRSKISCSGDSDQGRLAKGWREVQLVGRLSTTQIVLEGFALCASSVNKDACTHIHTHTRTQIQTRIRVVRVLASFNMLHCVFFTTILTTRNLTWPGKHARWVCPRACELWWPSAFTHDSGCRDNQALTCRHLYALLLCVCVCQNIRPAANQVTHAHVANYQTNDSQILSSTQRHS